MQHSYSLNDVHTKNAWLTIGSYDGVHSGHQQIIKQITAGAHQAGAPAVVLTFYPHPAVALRGRKDAFYLTLPDEKARILGEMGVDLVVTHPFDREVAAIEPEDFIRKLKKHLGFTHLWVGYDFALGKDRAGDVAALTKLGKVYDYEVHTIPAYELDGAPVSSSRVRQALSDRDIREANRLLGREFTVRGEVIPGDGRGRTIGIPTANIETGPEQAAPGTGVYACRAFIREKVYAAVTNIGVRPTFEDSTAPRIETHIMDFEGDLYGQEVGLSFVEFLRPEMKFESIDALVAQIKKDVKRGLEILKTFGTTDWRKR
jgi:riboflavin kinase/FMN adenylyltransferase